MKQKDIQRFLIAVLLVVEFCFIFLSVKSYSNKNIDAIQEVNEVDSKTFAMFIENDEGNYEEAIDTGIFPEGYILNLKMTSCIDNKGNNVDDILTLRDNKVTVKSNKTVFCYLYFDKDNRVFAQVKRDYKSNNGALLLSETESDEYPVYYYSGDITNNNILYANFCWKMVRTTETGGVKLIYNGVPDEGEDGTLTCDNTGEETEIGKSAFNSSSNSLAYFGYMYNKIYTVSQKNLTLNVKVMEYTYNNDLYYADTAVWNEEIGKYELRNSDGSDVITFKWADSYNDLIGKYTCNNATSLDCSAVAYVANGGSYWRQYYYLSNGKNYDDYKIKLATSVIANEDGTYTLNNPIEITKAYYSRNNSVYKEHYYCSDLTSLTCSDMYYSTSTNDYQLTGYNMSNVYKYGNSIIYEDGIYKLVDTKEFWNWSDNYINLNNYHYTCFNTTGECEQVYYIYYAYSTSAAYVTLSDGKNIVNAIDEMLYAKDVNKTNSDIKNIIDTWYMNNILKEKDLNEILYSAYLENTIWCNSRTPNDMGGWDSNGNITSWFSIASTMKCENRTDQFTLKVEAGGTEGYGNNALDYPIGMITKKEASLGGVSSNLWVNYTYLKSGSGYWVLNMEGFYGYSGGLSVGSVGKFHGYYGHAQYGVRPAVSLSNKVEITTGDGSVTLPYQVELSS